MTTVKPPKVFISYAREDAAIARRVFADLRQAGAEPWIDTEYILPGQRWSHEIRRAIRSSDFFLALLSSRSITKRGYVQKEVREALGVLEEIPQDSVYLIPARLDDCKPPLTSLEELNWVDLFPDYELGLEKILRVVRPPKTVKSGRLAYSYFESEDDLAQTGWAVVFAADIDPAVRGALRPLLERRREQAGHLYRELHHRHGESKQAFLARHGAGPGPADPARVPLYILLVGDPRDLPFAFHSQLAIQYRVGRLHFDAPGDYARYADGVISAEQASGRLKEAAFVGAQHRDDAQTRVFRYAIWGSPSVGVGS